MPAADIARQIGISRERVRQILLILGLPTSVPGEADYEHKVHVPRNSVGCQAELLVCADMLDRGFDTFRSVSSNARCDLVVVSRYNGKTLRIEVRNGRRRENGKLEYGKPTDRRFDVLAVVIHAYDIVYIPGEEIFEQLGSSDKPLTALSGSLELQILEGRGGHMDEAIGEEGPHSPPSKRTR